MDATCPRSTWNTRSGQAKRFDPDGSEVRINRNRTDDFTGGISLGAATELRQPVTTRSSIFKAGLKTTSPPIGALPVHVPRGTPARADRRGLIPTEVKSGPVGNSND